MKYKCSTDFIECMKRRGFLYQSTDEEALRKKFKGGPVSAYIGFDCTANSLHVGSLVQIMFLRWLQKFGNRPIVLLGSATSRVGDPSGKDKSRNILSESEISINKNAIQSTISKFLNFDDQLRDESSFALFVDNSDWLSDVKYVDFLCDVGRHFSVNRMLGFESVKLRLSREQHLSFLEFSYMVLQGYDFVELNRRYGCILQVGGADQWGNIVCGIDLGAKMDSVDMFGITTPLVKTSDGKKMGKTADGAIWLDGTLCSHYDYWQYFRNVHDDDVVRFLYLFTELDESEINRLATLKGREINDVKKILATEATAICHGRDLAQNALNASISEFENNDGRYLPSVKVNDRVLFKILVEIGFATSNSDAKRKINCGSVYVDGVLISDINFVVSTNSKISVGKRKVLIEVLL